MSRTRTFNIDVLDQVQTLAALDLIISLTGNIAGIMRHMSPEMRRTLWKKNNKTKTLGHKLREIDNNIQDLDPR